MSRHTLLVVMLLSVGTMAVHARLFQPHVDYAAGTNPQSVAIGDFNGDGKADMAVANNTDGTLSVLMGKGDGTFGAIGVILLALLLSRREQAAVVPQ